MKIQFGKWNNYHPLTEQIVAIATEVDVKSSQQIGTREPWLFFSRECLGLERCTEPNAIAQFGRNKEDKVPSSLSILRSFSYFVPSKYNIWIRATLQELINLQRKLIVRSSSKEVSLKGVRELSTARTKELSPNIRQ